MRWVKKDQEPLFVCHVNMRDVCQKGWEIDGNYIFTESQGSVKPACIYTSEPQPVIYPTNTKDTA